MERSELVEWIAMIGVIILWWPVVFMGWSPTWYYYPLIALSAVTLLLIFRNRFSRMQAGLQKSEQMMEQKRQMEEQARGGKPDLQERQAPDVSAQMPLVGPGGEGQLARGDAESRSQAQQRRERTDDERPDTDAGGLPFVPPTIGEEPPEAESQADEQQDADDETDGE